MRDIVHTAVIPALEAHHGLLTFLPEPRQHRNQTATERKTLWNYVGRDPERLSSQVGLQFVNKLQFFRKFATKPVALETRMKTAIISKTLHSKYEWLTCLWG